MRIGANWQAGAGICVMEGATPATTPLAVGLFSLPLLHPNSSRLLHLKSVIRIPCGVYQRRRLHNPDPTSTKTNNTISVRLPPIASDRPVALRAIALANFFQL